MTLAMTPPWTASSHHFAAGLVLAFVITVIARRWTTAPVAAVIGFGLTCAAEVVIELLEYPLLYPNENSVSAYYDTLADLGATLTGGLLGALLGLLALVLWGRRDPAKGAT